MVSSCGINTLNILGVIGAISGVVLLASFQSMYDAILEKVRSESLKKNLPKSLNFFSIAISIGKWVLCLRIMD